jgi:FixJ family two-component response regulator
MPKTQAIEDASAVPSIGGSRVWIVDDDPDIRHALTLRLQVESLTVRCFASAESFLAALGTATPHCVVLDHDLPDATGLEIQARLADMERTLALVFYSGHADVPAAVEAMRRGAIDFIEKPGDDARLLAAITTGIARSLAELRRRRTALRYRHAAHALTARERDVLDAIGRGLRNKHVANALGISPRTVESHRESAMRKLRARTAAQMIGIYLLSAETQVAAVGDEAGSPRLR